MALPPSIQTVQVNFGPFLDFEGNALPGSTTFAPSTPIRHEATGTPILNKPITVQWNPSGMGTIVLPATDSVGLNVTGFTYWVTHQVTDRSAPNPAGGTIALPAAAPVVDLDLLVPTTASNGVVVEQPEVISVAGLSGAISAEALSAAIGGQLDDAGLAALVAAEDSATGTALRSTFEARPGTPTLMAIGDSLTANGGGAIDPTTLLVEPSYNPTSYTFWAHLLSGGRFLHAGDAATGGYTAAQIRDTHLPTVLARRPTYCVVLVGQNSQTDLTAPVDIWEALVGAGVTPILCTLPATGTSAALWKFNQFVVRYATAHGLPLVDFHAATVDPVTGGYKAGYSGDGTHQTEAGAKAMGQALAAVLARIIPNAAAAGVLADTNAATDLKVGNPLMLTDDGGGLAANWMGLASFNGSFTTNPAVAGRVWTIAAPSAADSAVGTVFDVTPGHRYQIACKLSAAVETVGGGWVIRFLSIAPTVHFYTLAEFTRDAPIGSAFSLEWVCPATITTVRFDILAKTAAGASMSIGQFTVRDLTALGLA